MLTTFGLDQAPGIIPGDFGFFNNPACTTLAGLGGLDSIGGTLALLGNTRLADLSALSGLQVIQGDLQLLDMDSLPGLKGLEGISVIGGQLTIQSNAVLASLDSLQYLQTDQLDRVTITGNPLLAVCELEWLCNYLADNPSRVSVGSNASGCNSIAELQSACGPDYRNLGVNGDTALIPVFPGQISQRTFFLFPTDGFGTLRIDSVSLVDTAGVFSLAAFSASLPYEITGPPLELTVEFVPPQEGAYAATVRIYYNRQSESPNVLHLWGTTADSVSCAPPGNYFNSQDNIDRFYLNYPGCVVLNGSYTIDHSGGPGGEIVSLAGMAQVRKVTGNLQIFNNPLLPGLGGLHNLDTVGGGLVLVANPLLEDLQGLDRLMRIGSGINIIDNERLADLSDLQQVNDFSGPLVIQFNDSLTSLSGLENIPPSDIAFLDLRSSGQLSDCSLSNICTYLSDPGNPANIVDNAGGCATRIEITAACDYCPAANLLIDTLIDQTVVYQAADSLVASSVLDTGISVTYRAGSVVQLLPGFEAPAGVDFRAAIQSCGLDLGPAGSSAAPSPPVDRVASAGLPARPGEDLQVAPNPFRSETTLQVQLPEAGPVTLEVFDRNGRLVQTLALQTIFSAGRHTFLVRAEDLPSGIYIARLLTAQGVYGRKLVKQ